MATTVTDPQVLTLARALRALLAEKARGTSGFYNAIPGGQTPATLVAALDALITAMGG